MTLVGAGAAGFLLWLATQVGTDSNGEYWAFVGLIAGGGLAMALSQLLGGWTKWGLPRISSPVFMLGFLPALIVGGWILVATQPDANDAQTRAVDWAGSIGLGGLLDDLTGLFMVVAFGIGLVFGFTFDTTGPRRREVDAYEAYAAEEPVAAEREELATRAEFHDPHPDVVHAVGGDGRPVEIRETEPATPPVDRRREPH